MNDNHFTRTDGAAVGAALLAFFKLVPWPEIAAFLAALYTFLRLIGMVVDWAKSLTLSGNVSMHPEDFEAKVPSRFWGWTLAFWLVVIVLLVFALVTCST